MEDADTQMITNAEREQGWNVSIEKYYNRLQDQKLGCSIALVSEYNSIPVGYINVFFKQVSGPFCGKGYSEIVDLGVIE